MNRLSLTALAAALLVMCSCQKVKQQFFPDSKETAAADNTEAPAPEATDIAAAPAEPAEAADIAAAPAEAAMPEGAEPDGLAIPDASDVKGVREAKGSGKGRLSNVGFTEDYSDYVCYTRLTDADLRNLSPGELRVLRNTIYARHGRKFKSADLQRYFNSFPWYEPRYNEIDPSSLSAIEKHNISLIQKYE